MSPVRAKNHFPTHPHSAYPPAVRRAAALRMDLPPVCATRCRRGGDDWRGRPGFKPNVRRRASSPCAVSPPSRYAGGGALSRWQNLDAHFPTPTTKKRRRVRAQNAATPRRSSVLLRPPRQRLAGRALGASAWEGGRGFTQRSQRKVRSQRGLAEPQALSSV